MRRMLDCGMWTDPRVKALDPDARLLFVYLIANPHSHVSGLYWLPTAYMAHESGLSLDRVLVALDALGGLVEYDHAGEVVWVVSMAGKQCASSKVWKGCASQVVTLHGSPLIRKWAAKYGDRCPSVSALFAGSGKGMDRVSEAREEGGIPPSPVSLSVSVPVSLSDAREADAADHPAVLGLCDGWARAYAAPMSPAVLKGADRVSLVAQAEAAGLDRDAIAGLVEKWRDTTKAKRPHPRMVIADLPELLANPPASRSKPTAYRDAPDRDPSCCYRCSTNGMPRCTCYEPDPFPEEVTP